MLTFLSGLGASSLHVISGPDHLAAVTPLAIDKRKNAWLVGLGWGIGHTLGALIIGLLFFFFRDLIPLETLSGHSEQLVGFLLIAIGLWALFRVFGMKKHSHHYRKGNSVLVALLIGTVHGISGISHVFSILPTLVLPSRLDAILFLTAYALGTIVIMVTFAFLIGYLSYKTSEIKHERFFKILSTSGAVFAIGVGVVWILLSF